MAADIYLASRSPRRAEILTQLGVNFRVISADIDESCLLDEMPEVYVQRLALTKADAGWKCLQAAKLPYLPILAADTTVAVDGLVLGKPESDEEACVMLKRLSGGWHDVHTAIAVATEQGVEVMCSSTRVEMAQLSDAMIQAYVATGEPRDKAGAYGIQGLASVFIKRIDGSYSGVMGLPIFETAQLLSKVGVNILNI